MRYALGLSAGILGVVILCMALKLGFENRAAPRTSGFGGAMRAAPVDVLFVGSSHTHLSYDVHELQDYTGSSAFLVAYDGLDFRQMAEIVPALLNGPAKRPKVLVIDGFEASLVKPEGIEDTRLFFDAPPSLKWTLIRNMVSSEGGLRGWFDAFDLLANRDNELLLAYPFEFKLLNGLSYRGGYLGRTIPGLRSYTSLDLPNQPETPAPAEVDALRQVISAARTAGVHVVCMASPMPGPVERLPGIRSLKSQLRSLLEKWDVPYFDGAADFPLDDPALFADSNHLSTRGRALYTRYAAEFLDRTFGARLAWLGDGRLPPSGERRFVSSN